MSRHQSAEHAKNEIDAILSDMEKTGGTPRRAALRLRLAMDSLFTGSFSNVEELPVEIAVDVPKVTREVANHLVVHHLALAAAYFEASGVGLDGALATARKAGHAIPDISLSADRAWLRELRRSFRELDREEPSPCWEGSDEVAEPREEET